MSFLKFKVDVLNFYSERKRLNQLSTNLENATQGKLRKECLHVLRQRFLKTDEKTLKLFFDPKNKYKDLERCIQEFKLDDFKTLKNFLTGKTTRTSEENIKLLAWLINFEPRPYEDWKSGEGELKINSVLEKDKSRSLSLASEHNAFFLTPITLYQKQLSAISATASQEADFIENVSWSSKREVVHLSDVYTIREVESDIEAEIKKSKKEHKFIFLIGDAGNGKTSVLWHQYQHSKQLHGYFTLFLKATQLRTIDLENMVADTNHLEAQPLIFLDTVDLLLHDNEDRERLILFYNLIAQINGICVSCCRPQEISSLNPLKELFIENWRVFRIDNYSDSELENAIRRYSEIYYEQAPNTDVEKKIAEILFDAKNDRSLKPIYSNPLTNRMLFTLYAPVRLAESINVFKLYEQFWKKRVAKDARVGIIGKPRQNNANKDLSNVASLIALIMLATGNITLSKETLKRHANWHKVDDEDINILADRGILKLSNDLKEIEFFHQTFFEHAAAKVFIDLIRLPSINILLKKIFDEEGQPTTESFFLSPILEHLLLLAENSPIDHLAEKCCLSLLSSGIAEQIRIGLYVYALNTTHKPLLDQAIQIQLEAFKPDQFIYIKRFLQVAVNISDGRINNLFQILDVIWSKGDWNIRYNLIELLDYLVLKAPKEIIRFIDKHHLVEELTANYNIRGEKREHQPSFKDAVRILIVLAKNDLNFAKNHLLAIAAANDLSVNRFMLTNIAKSEMFNDDTAFYLKLYEIWMGIFIKSHSASKIPGHEFTNLLSEVLAICWLDQMPDVSNLLIQLHHEKIEARKHVELMTLAKVSYKFNDILAEMVFIYFKTSVEKSEIFKWSKYLIPFSRSTEKKQNLLESLFLNDIIEYLERDLAESIVDDQDAVVLACYKGFFKRITQDDPQYLFDFFEPYYLDKRYLAKNPELARLMLFAYLNGNISKVGLIENPDVDFYITNISVSKKLTSTINNEVIFTEKIFNFFVELCILKGELRLIASQLDRICPDIFVNNDEVPAYLFDHSTKMYEAAIKSITKQPDKCVDGAHLLAMLLKIGLIAQPSLMEIDSLFPNERRVEVLSWLFEIFPFCRHDSLLEATAILERCSATFDDKTPSLQEKSRCAFLRFVFESSFNLDFLQEQILKIYFDKRAIDKTSKRIKIINRILIKYADNGNPMSFHILYSLLSSSLLQSYSQNGQNETSHELHNGCVHVCAKLELEYLVKLSSLLKSTSCDYGRLILNGLSADGGKLSQLIPELKSIKSFPGTLPCIQNKLAHVLPYRLKKGSSNEWPELLNNIS